MDCSAFRKKHLLYVDEVLSGEQADAMQAHMRSCRLCAAYDARIRRALFLVRNMPRLEPAADFQDRLFRRIEKEQRRWTTQKSARPAGPSVGAFVASATSLILIGAMAMAASEWIGKGGASASACRRCPSSYNVGFGDGTGDCGCYVGWHGCLAGTLAC
jgi:anti-sigma factor RsiW